LVAGRSQLRGEDPFRRSANFIGLSASPSRAGHEIPPSDQGGGEGLIYLKITPRIGSAVVVLGVADDDLRIVTASGKGIRIQTKQVRASGRATQGFCLVDLESGDKICSVAKAEES
jgi:DNA gyrase/topoisomerase IV subunit A